MIKIAIEDTFTTMFKTKNYLKYFRLIGLFVLLVHSSSAQESFLDSLQQNIANIKEDLVKIKTDYYVIQPTGISGNMGVYIGTTGIFLVDGQWAKLAPQIKELLSTITDKSIRYLVNTHYHFDHTDGNKAFNNENITIIAQKNTRNRLSQDQMIIGFGLQKAYPVEALPNVTFNDTLTLYEGKETIELIHFPNAHTDGDAVVHFRNADIYHTGDIFENYGLPFVDENAGSDIYGTIQAVDYLLSVSNKGTRFIPGHGPVCTAKELAAYRKLLTSIRDQVIVDIRRGLTLEKITGTIIIDKNAFVMDRKGFIAHVYRMVLKHEKISRKKKPAQSN